MRKSLTMTVSSVLAFLILNNTAHTQQYGAQVKILVQHDYVSNVQARTQSPTTYTVVADGSLYKIALGHHSTLSQLYSYNPGATPLIFPGDTISLVPQNKVRQTKTAKPPVGKASQAKKVVQQPVQQASKKVAVKQTPKQTVVKTVNIAYKPA